MDSLTFPEISDGEDKSSPFKNALRNNYVHLRKWAKRTQTNAFRLYDRDIKAYPLIIDFYAERYCIYFISSGPEELEPTEALQEEISSTLYALFKASPSQIYWKTRKRREKLEQYEKLDASGEYFTIFEYGLKFKVNLQDYLDTGLFLDHRETRHLINTLSHNKRVLNLFAYTCSFSVHAAAGGATLTKSVDLSNTYTQWGSDNFALNSLLSKNHEIIRADCLAFLESEVATERKYDLIIIDPPTLSRSKKAGKFDIQLDYLALIENALKILEKKGTLFFSTNSRKFRFDLSIFENLRVQDISEKTTPWDIRHSKYRRCWKITLN